MAPDDSVTRPSWLRLCADGAFAVVVPSALWRVLMIVWLVPGTAELRSFELAGNVALALGYGYVLVLSAILAPLALSAGGWVSMRVCS